MRALQSQPACPADDRLLDYVDGRLAAPEQAEIDRHLDGCSSCTAVLAGLAHRSTLGPRDGTPLEVRPGSTIDRYVVRGRLGAGSMGLVVEAFDPELDRLVAIKLVHFRGSAAPDRSRVLREARAMARLSHPNIVPVLTVGLFGDDLYVVMERVEGTTMRAWLAVEPRRWSTIVRAYAAAGRGLAAAHAAGIVHRDFKPDNVLVGADGRVRVIDFGLARLLELVDDEVSLDSSRDPHGTGAGAVVGTPAYMAPEQLLDASVDAQADQFALAASLWEGLFGTRPFARDSLASWTAVERGPAAPPRGVRVPRAIVASLRRALSARPGDRFASTDAFVDALERDLRAPVRRAVAGVALGSIAIAWMATSGREDACEPDPAPRGASESDREALRAAFVRTGATASAGLAAERELQRRVLAWQDAFATACGAQDELRAAVTSCLDTRRSEIDAAFELLVDGDSDVLAQAADVIARLPVSTPCVERDEPRPAIADPVGIVGQTHAMRRDLARARTLGDAGRLDEAIAIANDVLVRAESLGHPAVRVEAELRVGALAVTAGDLVRGESLLESAFFAARELGHDEVAADAAITLVDAVGIHGARLQDAEVWLEHAEAALRAWPSPESHAALARCRGRLAQTRGDWDEALRQYGLALAIRREHSSMDDPRLARALVDMGIAEFYSGHAETAIGYYREALAVSERVFEPGHPQIAFAHNNIGMAQVELGQLAAAIEEHELALEMLVAAYGPEHLQVAGAHNNIGAAWGRAGEPGKAARAFAAALPAYERLGPDHPGLAMALANVGNAAAAADDFATALPALERALVIRERFHGFDDPATRNVVAGLGFACSRAGIHARAIDLLERAFQDDAPIAGFGPADLAALRVALGRSRLDRGDPEGAERELATAEATAASMPDPPAELRDDLEALRREIAATVTTAPARHR